MSRTRWAAALALILGAGFVLAACGGGSSTTTVQTRTVVRVVTTGTTSTTATPGVADTIVPGSTPGSIDTSDGGLNGFVPFARNSPWNTFADSQSVDMRSSALMRRARVRVGVKDNGNGFPKTFPETHNDGLYINTVKWTDVVTTTVSGVPTPLVCRQPPLLPRLHDYCGDGWSVSSLSIPVNASPFPQYDGWFTIIDRAHAVAYDLWRARRSRDGQSISYQFMRKWDLNGAGFLVPNTVSARGSGLPLFAGMIYPWELRGGGQINHALAISVPGAADGTYVQPASSTDGVGAADSLPEGARIKLKAKITAKSIIGRFTNPNCDNTFYGIRTNTRTKLCHRYKFPSRTNIHAMDAIIKALHTYGAIVVDRSRVPTLYAQSSTAWSKALRDTNGNLLDSRGHVFTDGRHHRGTPLLRGNEVQGLRLTDFDVVSLPPAHKFPDPTDIHAVPLFGVTGQSIAKAPTVPAAGAQATTRGQQRFQAVGGGQ